MVGTMKNLSRRDLLKIMGASGVCASSLGRLANAQSENPSYPYILVIECSGGWDQTTVFDNKQSVPTVSTDPSSFVQSGPGNLSYVTNAAMPSVQTFFDNFGENSTIVNGIYCHELDHKKALRRTNSTYSVTSEQVTSYLAHYATIVGAGRSFPHLVSDLPFEASLYDTFTFMYSLEDVSTLYPSYMSGFSSTSVSALRTYLNDSYSNFAASRISNTYSGRKIISLASKAPKEDAAVSILTSNYDATQSTNLRKRATLALNMFKNGYSQSAHILDETTLSWDSHENTISAQRTNFERLFADLNEILTYATSLNIQDNLVVIVKSEFGRHPRLINNGKNHWPFTSCLIWNKQLTGAKVCGQTDDYLRGKKLDPYLATEDSANAVEITFDSIFAGIFQRFAVAPSLLWPATLTPNNFIL